MKCYLRYTGEDKGVPIDDCPLEGIEERIRQLRACGDLHDRDSEVDTDYHSFQLVRENGEIFIEIIYGEA